MWTGQRLPAGGPSFLAGNPDTDQSPDDQHRPEVVGDLAEAFGDDGELLESGQCFNHESSLGPGRGQVNARGARPSLLGSGGP